MHFDCNTPRIYQVIGVWFCRKIQEKYFMAFFFPDTCRYLGHHWLEEQQHQAHCAGD